MLLYNLRGYIKCLKPWKANRILMMLSLALSLGIFFFLSLYVEYANGLNSAFSNSDRIYRLINERSINEQVYRSKLDSYPVADTLQNEFSEGIEAIARLYSRGSGIEVERTGYGVNISLVDKEFFDIFDLATAQGDLRSVLDNPRNVAIEANFAKTLFGTSPALGKPITLNIDRQTSVDYVVSAVFEYPKGNISINYPLLALLDPAAVPEMSNLIGMRTGGMSVQTFVLARQGVDVERGINEEIRRRLGEIFPEAVSSSGSATLVSQQLQSIRNISRQPVDGESFVNNKVVNSLRALALLVYVSGLVNFVLLTVSNYSGRTKEFSVRRAAGSGSWDLFVQLSCESLLFASVVSALLWLMTESLLPAFGAFVAVRNLEDAVPATAPLLVVALGAGMLCVVALPFTLLRNISPLAKAQLSPRNAKLNFAQRASLAGLILVAYSTLMITFVLNEEMQYLKSRGLGLDPANVYSIEMLGEGHSTIDDLVLQLASVDGVSHVTRASTMAMTQLGSNTTTSISVDNSILGSVVANKAYVGTAFFEMYGMTFLAGTSFDALADGTSSPDKLRNYVVINEKLVDALGFDSAASAVGQVVYEKMRTTAQGIHTSTFTIAGVIANSRFFSLVDDYRPEAYFFMDTRLGPSLAAIVSYKIDSADVTEVTANVQRVLNQNFPNREFTIYDAEFAYQLHFSSEDRMLKMYKLSALLTGAIALLTLYSYLEFHVKTRARALAIRRVLGESLVESFGYLMNRNVMTNSAAIVLGGIYSYAYVSSWLAQFTLQLGGARIAVHAIVSVLLLLCLYTTMNLAFAVYLSNKRVIEDLKEE